MGFNQAESAGERWATTKTTFSLGLRVNFVEAGEPDLDARHRAATDLRVSSLSYITNVDVPVSYRK